MAAGTAQGIHLLQRHLMNTAQEAGNAQNGMETTATNGNALHFQKVLWRVMTSTAQNGTARHGTIKHAQTGIA